ncbi:MAG: uroporphyrinogen-III C-methyltransferase [Acidimicrobiales bacterium]
MTVHLVGAGPGDSDLLTLRAARLLAACDVVVYDRLVDPAVLELARPAAERIDVGKRRGAPLNQDLITTLLVQLGRAGRDVVRLKGGDPFVFGRGGEEAAALAAAGVAFDVTPGVTSAVGAPAYAGIPVTHRGLAASFTVVTGHRGGDAGSPPTDWSALARVGGTIVVLMGVTERAEIADALLRGGLSPATPVAAVQWGTRAGRQTVRRTRLDQLGDTPVEPPATLVIGAVAALDLAWFEPGAAATGVRAVVKCAEVDTQGRGSDGP